MSAAVLFVFLAAIVGVYVFHKMQVESGKDGIPPLQDVLKTIDEKCGTKLAPTIDPGKAAQAIAS